MEAVKRKREKLPTSSGSGARAAFICAAVAACIGLGSCCCPAARKPDCTTAKTGISGSIWKRDNHTGDDDANGGRTTPLLNMAYSVEQHGSLYKDDYRLYFKKADGTPISPMHDIPLYHDEGNKVFNMVVEVPRWSNAKMEINLKQKLNPVKQDVKKGKLRFVANCYPHKGYKWNYGYIPQTWEDPDHVDPSTNCKGDGDPIDVCEIGKRTHKRGEVVPVKVLGTLALIDEGETDWKLLVIDTRDPLAEKLNDVDDINKHMPGFIAGTVEWFKIYKMPDGKPPNEFAFDGRAKDREFALKVIGEVHDQWKSLMAKDGDTDVSRVCTQFEGKDKISADDAKAILAAESPAGPDAEVPDSADGFSFVDTTKL